MDAQPVQVRPAHQSGELGDVPGRGRTGTYDEYLQFNGYSWYVPEYHAFYLMSRIPYLRVFANGNKRTARLAANIPLLKANLLPISFGDFRKADYILGMSAFYELGERQVLQHVFVEGYIRCIVRSSDLPVAMRLTGLNLDEVIPDLFRYVRVGVVPQSEARIFLADH